MRCPNCGRRNPEGVRTCRSCGERLGPSKRERRVLLGGMLIIVLILLAGLIALMLIARYIRTTDSTATGVRPSILQPTVTATPTPAPDEGGTAGETGATDASAEGSDSATEPAETQPAEPQPITGELIPDRSTINLRGYTPVTVAQVTATSTIYQPGYNNNADRMVDGSDYSSWQEGVDGPGIGESATFVFDREYNVRFLALHLGNWTSGTQFSENNRPQRLQFRIGTETFSVDFPDGMEERVVELSADCPASDMTITIESVYSGYAYDDTCISEVEIIGY